MAVTVPGITADFKRQLSKLTKAVGGDVVLEEAEAVAWELLARAENAPIPRDTGLLASSAFAKIVQAELKVLFGYNREYAAIQDLGGKRLPPKPYGSAVGPNFYFSETLRRNQKWFLEEVAKRVQRRLGK